MRAAGTLPRDRFDPRGRRIFAATTRFIAVGTRGGRSASAAALACFTLYLCQAALAQPPILQVDAGMHIAPIPQMRLDELHGRFVTVSTDRTARIWRLADLKLLRTVHIDATDSPLQGELHAIAIDPTGRDFAVGGFTGSVSGRSLCVYIQSLDTGSRRHQICGFKQVIQSLSYSLDGQYLAVGLGGEGGVRVYRTSGWSEVGHDFEYRGPVVFLDYSIHGDLAVTADDGYLRLYSAGFRSRRSRKVSDSDHLGGVRFSPDGNTMAIGVVDRKTAVLVDSTSFDVRATPRVSDPAVHGLCCVAFSRDGRYLFLNGDGSGKVIPLYRSASSGDGNPEVFWSADHNIENMMPLPSGQIAVVTETPILSIIGPKGDLLASSRAATADFRGGRTVFAASRNGAVVRVPMNRDGGDPILFSVTDTALLDAEASSVSMESARTAPAGVQLSGIEDSGQPRLNGRDLLLLGNERPYSYAFSPDSDSLVLGTSWSVHRFSRDGTELWKEPPFLQAPVRSVLVTRDLRYVIAAVSDGTVRWFRYDTGKECLALYLHSNRKDWVLWLPSGYYASSDDGDRYVGWLHSNGADKAPDFFRAAQFERLFYRPDLIRSALTAEDRTSSSDRATTGNVDIREFARFAPPRVLVSALPAAVGSSTQPSVATIRVEATRLSDPMRELIVYVNGLPVTPRSERQLEDAEENSVTREFTIPLTKTDNEVRVELTGSKPASSYGLDEIWVSGPDLPARDHPTGDLFVVAVGVNQFTSPIPPSWRFGTLNLNAAASDASALASRLSDSARSLFHQVHVATLDDDAADKPTKSEILKAFDLFHASGPDDTVILFLASHGFADRRGNYYFVPRDAQPEDIRAVLEGGDESGTLPSLLSWTEIFDALRSASGRRILIVDTCGARSVATEKMPHTLRKRSASSLFALVLASQANEESQESWELGHGVFTYGLLEALEGSAQIGHGVVTLKKAFDHAVEVVGVRRPHQERPQNPQLFAPVGLGETPIALIP